MKILLFDNDDFSDYTSYFARGISKYADVTLYCFSEKSAIRTGAAKQKNIKINFISRWLPKSYSSVHGIFRTFILFFIIFGALLRTRYDIVHIQDYLPTFFLFTPFLKIRKKKIIWTLHDLDILCLWDRLFASGMGGRLQVLYRKLVTQPKYLSSCADCILVHALSHKHELKVKKVKEKKIRLIRQLDYAYLLECRNNNGDVFEFQLKENSVLFFGNIAPWKGIDTLLKAASIVLNKIGSAFNLVIAGIPYPGFQELEFFGKTSQEASKCITLVNRYIESSEIPALICKSSFLVLPYDNQFRYSSSGIIPLAYTFEKPVIVSNVSSLAEYVEDGKTGRIFNVKDSEELAYCMIDLIKDNRKCLEMGKNAYQKLAREMSLDTCCKSIYDIYKSVTQDLR